MGKKTWMILVAMLSLAAACGYRLEGGGYLNEDITRVAVKVFENKSSETGAGNIFTNRFIEEILKKTDTVVVAKNVAEYVMEGQINSITFSTLSRATTDAVAERRVTARIDVYIKNSSGEVVWAIKNFKEDEAYTVSDNVSTDSANKQEAVDKIAERSAERLVSRMLNNF